MTPNNKAAAQLLALAERCEKASGPDRELDAAIYYDHLGHCRHARTERSGAQSDTGFDCLDCGADSWGNLGSKGQRLHDVVPAFTASIDAAMKLVPEGWTVAQLGESDRKGWWAELRRGYLTSYDATSFSDQLENSTPALALTAAALRARATMETTDAL